jgi:hypothetical protein
LFFSLTVLPSCSFNSLVFDFSASNNMLTWSIWSSRTRGIKRYIVRNILF